MTTTTIALATLQVGTLNFGPAPAADTDTEWVLSLDRTVAGGLNELTADTTIVVEVSQSNDGGATWQDIAGAGMEGGVYINTKTGLPYAASGCGSNLQPGTSRLLRAAVTVAGTPVAVAGTLIIQ